MKIFLASISLFTMSCFGALNTASALAETPEILYLLDASGSMNDHSGGETRLESAKKALKSSLALLPEGTPVGFRVFAHRIAQQNKAESCKDTELVAPISSKKTGKISSALEALKAKGYTPLAYSIHEAASDFSASHESPKVIILLSDGEETCGGDPATELARLKEKGINLKFYAVGFNVDDKSRKQLQELSKLGNGEYYDAKDSSQLTFALEEATKKSLIIKKKKSTYGEEVRGGDSFETALPIELNKDYKLDHHQMPGYFDYFSFDIPAGQEVIVSLKSQEEGLIQQGNKYTSTKIPQCNSTLNATDHTQIGQNYVSGQFGKNEKIVNVRLGGKYYLLLGEARLPMHQDGCTFKIIFTAKGDLGTSDDASDSTASAHSIEAKNYPTNYIGGTDEKDVFKFQANKGQKVAVGLVPGDGSMGDFKARVINSYKQELVQSSSTHLGEGFKTKEASIEDDGTYFLEISLRNVRTLEPYGFQLFLSQSEAKTEQAQK